MRHFYLLTLLFLCSTLSILAQPPCPNGEQSVIVSVLTDGYGYEVSWEVSTVEGDILAEVPVNTLANNALYETQVCIPEGTCVKFTIRDSYGDGLLGNAYVNVTLDDELILEDPSYNFEYTATLNCAPGQVCEEAIPVEEGTYTTSFDNHWYSFTPDSIGTYLVTTCGLSECDTKIWIYTECDGNGFAEDNAGITFFDDNDSECAPQAQVEGYFDPNTTYLIRIGDNMDACGDEITWQIVYLGPVVGCTDPNSCNYNPLATIDDGSCLSQGDPDCPEGPDLVMRQDVFENSLSVSTINNNDPCLIEEGCVTGYGQRDVIRFSTRIDNIGENDYYIGVPNDNNEQFTYNNCHNHYHYDGYAEYLLFDNEGAQLPSGFKNGFCVIDLGCMWGSAQFGCGNMGITAGCYDEYWSGLSCQWVDITDVPDGDYTFVTRVNWDNAPDFLGQLEKDTLNNWAQVCINVDRSSGSLQVAFDAECEPFTDCAGTPYGNAQPDCNGDCNGTALRGDLNQDGLQEIVDAQTYVTEIIAQDIDPTDCNDLNTDGKITVYDAALLADCINYGNSHIHQGVTIHDHCNLPGGILNSTDTVLFTIMDVNFSEGYVDIGMLNRNSRISAYQFSLQGIQATGVESLVDSEMYPIAPVVSMATNEVIGISYQDSTIERSVEYQPISRVFFSEVTEAFICLSEVEEAVNHFYEQTTTIIENACVEVVGTEEEFVQINVEVIPNPAHSTAVLNFPNPFGLNYTIELTDAQGRLVRKYTDIQNSQLVIERENLTSGVYFYHLRAENVVASGRLVFE